MITPTTAALALTLLAGPLGQETTMPEIESRNRLGEESSPYLLQHAMNPVHWWPWGEEAFAAARALDRPIFLSIGYSTCYWCHVMERECFENEEIAAYLNEHYICIKVDREERPDVDDVYMAAVQMINQRGGWPMSVFLEPEQGRPFFGGTYFPPGTLETPGFIQLTSRIIEVWNTNRDALVADSERIAVAIRGQMAAPVAQHGHAPGSGAVDLAVTQLMSNFDAVHAGFGRGPTKFPTPVNLDFLIAAAWDRPDVQAALRHTCDRMATGGVYDQVGGGFHRYSTDVKWLVPHFEKMLYDNGQLASTYSAMYERTNDAYYAEIIRETLDYVLREMHGPEGAFLSAQDAEVNHREGENYIWTRDQMTAALADRPDDVDFTLDVYGVSAGANFQDPHHPTDGPKNVLFLDNRPDVVAERLGMDLDTFTARVSAINEHLRKIRDQRDQPITDDKLLTAWNGLMIAGFADGGRVLASTQYIDVARRAADRVLARMQLEDGSLARSTRGDLAPRIHGFLEDYAGLIHGLLALEQATGEQRWLDEASRLADEALSDFHEVSTGAYYEMLDGQSDLFVRVRNSYDGATPSGSGLMMNNLVTLAIRTGEARFAEAALRGFDGLSEDIAHRPAACITTMLALTRMLKAMPERFGGGPDLAAETGGPVTARLSSSTFTLAEGESASLDLVLTVAPSFHINSSDPGPEFLIPLTVQLIDGAGLELTTDYPNGARFVGPDQTIMQVHSGQVTIGLTVRRTGEVTGNPKLVVTWQACTEQACLAAETKALNLFVK